VVGSQSLITSFFLFVSSESAGVADVPDTTKGKMRDLEDRAFGDPRTRVRSLWNYLNESMQGSACKMYDDYGKIGYIRKKSDALESTRKHPNITVRCQEGATS
jgi:hypothetical protein